MAAGNIMIAYSNINLTTINGVAIPGGDIPSLLHAPSGSESINVTSTVSNPPLTTYTFNDLVPGIKAFGVGPTAIDTAKLQYSVTSGYALPGFLNLDAHIFSVISPLMETTTTAPDHLRFFALRKRWHDVADVYGESRQFSPR